MIKEIKTQCSDKFYTYAIQPFVNKGYDESVIAQNLMMMGYTMATQNKKNIEHFEAGLELLQTTNNFRKTYGGNK